VPITSDLADKLKRAASDRSINAPLLMKPDGTPWTVGDQRRPFQKVMDCLGLTGTVYLLRHSSIIRSLLAGTPTRLVASLHDTSVTEIERTYSVHIADHGEAIARRGLLTRQPASDKIIPLRK
jgi:hypothetical protein